MFSSSLFHLLELFSPAGWSGTSSSCWRPPAAWSSSPKGFAHSLSSWGQFFLVYSWIQCSLSSKSLLSSITVTLKVHHWPNWAHQDLSKRPFFTLIPYCRLCHRHHYEEIWPLNPPSLEMTPENPLLPRVQLWWGRHILLILLILLWINCNNRRIMSHISKTKMCTY